MMAVPRPEWLTEGATALAVDRSGGKNLEIVITARGDTLDAPFDTQFGRAPTLILYDLEQEEFFVIDNRHCAEAAQGAGLQAAQGVVRLGAVAVVTGHCGPKALQLLSSAGVAVYSAAANTVAEALAQFREGRLSPLAQGEGRS